MRAVIEYWIQISYQDGKVLCSRCGSEQVYERRDRPQDYCCRDCGTTTSVFAHTIFHKSRTDIRKWFYAIYRMAATDRFGYPARQLMREIGVTYKCAWRILHKIREAMGRDVVEKFKLLVEADETFVGGKPRKGNGKWVRDTRRRATTKTPVLTLFDRRTGLVKASVTSLRRRGKRYVGDKMVRHIVENVEPDSIIFTDEHPGYNALDRLGWTHMSVAHNTRYVSEDGFVHNNGCESFHNTVKRTHWRYHKMGKQHLQSYMNECVYRWNTRNMTRSDCFDKLLMLGALNRRAPRRG